VILPEGSSVRFHIMAADAIHEFWVPALLSRRDAIPGREKSYVGFTPNRAGPTSVTARSCAACSTTT
jgi:heme/copper-type cytochrome/quinol oxidase subunit 2